jgi:hypothetical protein
MSEIDLVPPDIKDAFHGTTTNRPSSVKTFTSTMVDKIKERKLASKQFTALRKIKKVVDGLNRANIFHLAMVYNKFDVSLFESTSDPLNAEQVKDILLEESSKGKTVFGVSAGNYSKIRSIITKYSLDPRLFKEEVIKNIAFEKCDNFFQTKFEDFIKDICFFGHSASVLVNVLNASESNPFDINVPAKDVLEEMFSTMKKLKASPEDYLNLFCFLHNKSIIRNTSVWFPPIEIATEYAKKIAENSHQDFNGEEALLKKTIEIIVPIFWPDHKKLAEEIVYGIKFIASSRRKVGSMTTSFQTAKSISSAATGLDRRRLSKGAIG